MAEKKRIWVINQFAGNPESGWGERHFYFAKEWVKQGHEVVIFSSTYNHMFRKFGSDKETYNDDQYEGIRFCWIKIKPYDPESGKRFLAMLSFAWKVLSIPVKTYGKPDVILVSSMPIFPIYTGNRLAKKFGARLLFEIRDVWPMTLQSLKNLKASHPLVKFIGYFEKFGYRKSDAVITLLPNAFEHINRVAGKKVNTHYIPNGFSKELLNEETLPSEIKSLIPKNKFVICYTGTLGAMNVMEYFVEAAKMLSDHKDIHFLIIGDGYLKPQLEKQAESLTNITFSGKVLKKWIQGILKEVDVCYVGRHGYDLYKLGVSANKYFDYMMAAKPVVDSNNLIKDPVELSGCGFVVPPENAQAIADAILKIYKMTPEERHAMGMKGKDFVLQNHDIAGLAADYARLF